MVYGQRIDWDELRRKANRNLVKLASGEIKRKIEADRAYERKEKEYRISTRRDLTAEIRDYVTRIKRWRDERLALQSEYQWLYDKHTAGELETTIEMNEYACLEEVDHRIDTLMGREIEGEERLEQLRWMLSIT